MTEVTTSFIHSFKSYIAGIYKHRELLATLSIRDFKNSYIGNSLGFFWVIAEPAIYIAIMWIFFTKALKFKPNGDSPYIAWLMSSMVMWNFLSATIQSSISVFRTNIFMLRRREFNFATLPLIKLTSNLYVHGVLLGLLLIVLLGNGIYPTVYWLQSLYFLFCGCILVLGISFITASTSLFVRDISQLTSVLLQLAFWVSPIMWDAETYPQDFKFLLTLNPLAYPIAGYRNSFISQVSIFSNIDQLIYFWGITALIWIFAYFIYKNLKPQFGDVV